MRRTAILATGLAALLLLPAHATQSSPSSRMSTTVNEAILDVLEQSQKTGKGVLIYLGSHAIGGAVVKIGEQTVELKSREYSRIVLRLDRIEGVAGN